jgi:hypothetical protein
MAGTWRFVARKASVALMYGMYKTQKRQFSMTASDSSWAESWSSLTINSKMRTTRSTAGSWPGKLGVSCVELCEESLRGDDIVS